MKFRFFLLLFLVATMARAEFQREFVSPKKDYTVRMPEMPNLVEEHPMQLFAGNRKIAEFPIQGFLFGVFWSPDGRYVAINNRNANSGDYVWLISLKTGKTIMKPYGDWPLLRKTKAAVSNEWNEDKYSVGRQYIYTTGWKNDLLVILMNTTFRGLDHYLSSELHYAVKDDKLTPVADTEKRVPFREKPAQPPGMDAACLPL